MEQLKKSDFIALFLSSVFAISTTVSANTCTDAVFKEIAGYYMIEDSGLKLDSVIFNRYSGKDNSAALSNAEIYVSDTENTKCLN